MADGGRDAGFWVLLVITLVTAVCAAYTLLTVTGVLGSAAPAPGKTRAEGDGEPDERTEAVASAGLASAIGDSAMLGAIDALEQEMPNLVLIDDQGNRQVHNQDLAEILEYPRHLVELLCCQRAVVAYVDDHYVPEMAGRAVPAE